MKRSERQLRADKFCIQISNYLEDAGWKEDANTFYYIDPITNTKHDKIVALNIQLDRDLAV